MKILMYFAQHVFRKQIGICLVLSLLLLIGPAEAYESFTTSVEAYQGFTISSGMSTLDNTVITIIIGTAEEISAISAPNIDPLFDFSPPVDILFGLTTDPNHPIEIVAERIAGIVVLEDTAVEDVTDDLLATLDCTERTVKIDSNDIVVLRMNEDQDEYAMLSNIRKYPDATVRLICWREGTEIPEVTTLVLLSVGIGFLIGMMKRKQHNRSRKGGRAMKHFKTLLLALVLLPLLVGTASSAQLKVLIIGTGKGDVEGEEISCPSFCEETYEKGSVVQLKAFPDDDSTFEGWMVNGKPHEGVITIDQEVILLTARFERNTPPDESIVMWYDGNRKMGAILAFDEIAIVPAQKPENPYILEGEFKTAMEEVARLFHPQARITGWGDGDITVKSPEPVTKGQLFESLAAIKQHEYVRETAPILYFNPNVPESQIIPSGTLSVWFPKTYTDDQIQALEQAYGLVRWRVSRINPHHIVYEAESPWKAFEIANQLYESGLVEYASPDYSTLGVLYNQLLEVDSIADHWHFRDPSHNGADIFGAWALHDKKIPPNPIRGSGVVIGIQDDGVEIAHPDLTENIAHDLCFDYVDSWGWGVEIEDQDPTPTKILTTDLAATMSREELKELCGGHGTGVTGIAAGKGFNSIGIYGIASEAKIAAYRTSGFKIEDGSIVYPKFPKEKNIGADVLERYRDEVHIYNHSLGHIPHHLTLMNDEVKYQLESGAVGIKKDDIEPGRNKLGNIFVDSAGNEREKKDNTNYNARTNSRYTIAVAASTEDGTIAPYSTPGANVLVNAPCDGIPTTDRMGEEGYNPYFDDYGDEYPDFDYKYYFAGTSAAAPVVSGILGLMLQANSKLDWRDVQYILIETAEKNPGEVWKPNAAGYAHSYDYGFGRVNAKKAVEAALSWTEDTVPDEREGPIIGENTDKETISPNEEIPKEIEMTENIRVEFVEVELDLEYHHWCLLEVELSSPDGTTSVLSPESSCSTDDMYLWEKYGFEYWRFGSVRHFGESSTGKWTLTIRHKGWYDDAEFKKWNIALYGTELPPYVQAVEARSGDELIYAAEWVVEEDGQLEFVESVEPQQPSNTTPLHLTIMTSEAMQWLSLNLFDKDFSSKEGTRKIQKADKTGTVWEVTLDPADFPQDDVGDENTLANVYPLTITGQDRGDLSLLPFADRSPKTLPTHPSEADWPAQPNAGDTVHQLGKILSEPFQWSIMMPTPGTCDYDVDRGGIVCTFDEGAGFALTEFSWQAFRDAGVPETVINSLQNLQGQRFPTEQDFLEAVQAQLGDAHTVQYLSLILEHAETAKGRVILYPKDVVTIDPNIQYVIIGSVGQNSTTWEGTYQVPTEGSGDLALGVAWEPQEAWFPFREPTPEQQELWCAENPPDYKPNEPKGPPASDTDTATLQWTITAQPNPANESCQVRVTWEAADVEEEARTLLLDLQPQSLCEAFQDQTGTVEATTTYPWDIVDRLEYTGCHIVDEQPELLEHIRVNTTHKYWPIPKREKVLEPGQCRSWYKQEYMFRFLPERWPSPLPQDIPRPTSPEEGDIAIQYECQWFEDVDAPFDVLVLTTHWTWTYRCPTVYVEGEGRQTPYLGGYQCNKTITHLTWECGDKCTYQELSGEFVPPVPGLERELTLHP